MIEHHLMRLRARHLISTEEEHAIRATIGERRKLSAGSTFIRAGERLHSSTLLLSGMMCRYKDLQDGHRQITEVHVAGDFADLHSYTLKVLDHNIMALTPCEVALVPHDNLRRLTHALPRLADIYWFSTNLDAAIHREWMLSLGRRSAISRAAALFCELQVRLELVGLADAAGFRFDINQAELAECLGLTSIHVNRVLRELREQRLVTFRSRRVDIHDRAGLCAVAEFDPSYLYLHPHAL